MTRPRRQPPPNNQASAVPPELVVVGRVGGAYGLAGQVRITSETVPADNITSYRPWLLGAGSQFREVAVARVRPHGGSFVAELAGVSDRDQAQALAGQLIAVPRSALPDLDGEYYWRDLLGLTVLDSRRGELGRVDRLLETGAHDVLVVVGDGPEVLIPFSDPFVVEVDLAGGRIRVDWQD